MAARKAARPPATGGPFSASSTVKAGISRASFANGLAAIASSHSSAVRTMVSERRPKRVSTASSMRCSRLSSPPFASNTRLPVCSRVRTFANPFSPELASRSSAMVTLRPPTLTARNRAMWTLMTRSPKGNGPARVSPGRSSRYGVWPTSASARPPGPRAAQPPTLLTFQTPRTAREVRHGRHGMHVGVDGEEVRLGQAVHEEPAPGPARVQAEGPALQVEGVVVLMRAGLLLHHSAGEAPGRAAREGVRPHLEAAPVAVGRKVARQVEGAERKGLNLAGLLSARGHLSPGLPALAARRMLTGLRVAALLRARGPGVGRTAPEGLARGLGL